MKPVCIVVTLFMMSPAVAAGQGNTAVENVAAAVPPALRFMEEKTVAWKDKMGCASCHHAPMMLWSSELAKSKGFEVDEAALANIRNFLLEENNAAKLFPPENAPPDRDGTQIGSIYALLALSAGPGGWEQSPLATKTRMHFTKMQRDDGAWPPFPSGGRPPILEQNGAGARLLVAMLAGLPEAGETPETAGAVEKAKGWLAAPLPDVSHQVEVFQLLAELATGAPEAVVDARITSLLALQRADGSWGQTPAMAGDALATGQTLYALARAGKRLGDAPVDRAVQFLRETQQADGVWPMVSRPVVGSRADGTTEGSGNLEPLVTMAAGWALVGMLSVY